MEFIDYIAFVMIFLLFGFLLYIPLRWWAKWKLRNTSPESDYKLHITSAGLAWIILMISALLIGFPRDTFSPETEFGRFISTVPGKFYYVVIVFLFTVVFGLILQKLGFTLFKHPDNDE